MSQNSLRLVAFLIAVFQLAPLRAEEVSRAERSACLMQIGLADSPGGQVRIRSILAEPLVLGEPARFWVEVENPLPETAPGGVVFLGNNRRARPWIAFSAQAPRWAEFANLAPGERRSLQLVMPAAESYLVGQKGIHVGLALSPADRGKEQGVRIIATDSGYVVSDIVYR